MATLDFSGDATRAMDVMQRGGIAILPNDVGYSLIAATAPALNKIFQTKRRKPENLETILGCKHLFWRKDETVDAVTPLGKLL